MRFHCWFTASDSNKDDEGTDVNFGKVAISVNGTASYTKTHEAALTVDGCSWEISGLSLNNTSTVDIYYMYKVEVTVTGLTDEEKAYFTIPDGANKTTQCAKLTAGTAAATLDDITVSFDSKGAMNGSTKTAVIKVTVTVVAVQADHNTIETATTQLTSMLAGTFTQTAVNA